MDNIILNEATHSIFYAPLYVSMELEYFKRSRLKIFLENGNGSDKTMEALLSGSADIGLLGPETTLYLHNKHIGRRVVNFAQLTNHAGNFLISREPYDDFDWDYVRGKTILGDRNDGMPEIILEYILRSRGIDPENDVYIDQSIPFGETADEFIAGVGDFTIEFEPDATRLELEHNYHIVASLGTDCHDVPYTTFASPYSYITSNSNIIQRFTNAMQKGMKYVSMASSKSIAKVIAPQFPYMNVDTITVIVDRYKQQGTWKNNLVFPKASFNLLEDILVSSNRLSELVPYKEVGTTHCAKRAFCCVNELY